MFNKIIYYFSTLTVLMFFLQSCATGPRDYESPIGPISSDQLTPFHILGVISRNTSTLNRSSAHHAFEETITVNIPPGTSLIIPAIRGWVTGYGKTDPEDLSALTSGETATWHTADHHLGFQQLNIFVADINAVDFSTSPPTQTATITIQSLLSDDNGDDSWFGDVNYNLICLGPDSLYIRR